MRAASTFTVECPCGATVATDGQRLETQTVCPQCKRVLDVSAWRRSYEQQEGA